MCLLLGHLLIITASWYTATTLTIVSVAAKETIVTGSLAFLG